MSRNYCFTINNYTLDTICKLKNVKSIKYIGWAEEIAPTTNTPHLQGLVCFDQVKSFKAASKLIGGHLEIMMGRFEQARDYFAATSEKKPDEVKGLFEFGTLPMDQKAKGLACQELFAESIKLAKEGKIDEINPGIQLRFYNTLKCMHRDEQKKRKYENLDTTKEKTGLWIWGPTNTGKSHTAREMYPEHYAKDAATKWWCDYNHEKQVLIDDFDRKHEYQGYHLKIWADKYPFPAEVKFGALGKIRPERIVVTSNYHPSTIWSDKSTLEPILRRFEIVELFNAYKPFQ